MDDKLACVCSSESQVKKGRYEHMGEKLFAWPGSKRRAAPSPIRPHLAPMVFSGIVEEMGEVVSYAKLPSVTMWDGSTQAGWVLVVTMRVGLGDAYIGASIAINGVCLTVTEMTESTATFGIAPETIRRTNLGSLTAGAAVNVERSLATGARNSGHYVQGHVDGTGAIAHRHVEGDSLWIRVAAPPEILDGIVEKGYIAVDGTSLTVCEVNRSEGWFSFMLIAHTQQCIIVPKKAVGDKVNLEVDIVTKAQRAAMEGGGGGGGGIMLGLGIGLGIGLAAAFVALRIKQQ